MLEILGPDGRRQKIILKNKYTTPLRKLMDAYCCVLGLRKGSSLVRFTVDGELIKRDDTAERLGLETGDFIDCDWWETDRRRCRPAELVQM